MQIIPAAELLNLWERGEGKSPYERALDLLASAFPETPRDSLAQWSLGQRDASLITLQEGLFGERINAVAVCPFCTSRLELNFRAAEIRAPYARGEPRQFNLQIGGDQPCTVELRPVTTQDLIEVAERPSRMALLGRCLVRIQTQDRELITSDPQAGVQLSNDPHQTDDLFLTDDLQADFLDECSRLLADCDPQADIQLALTCPECAGNWDAPLDIVSFLWNEIDAWARRTLREVHLLASKYGWSESEILNLSARRRQFYLQMVSE